MLLDTVIALIATVIMFSVIFSVPGMEEQVGASTVGMLFISLPQVFYSEVPFGALLGPLFYVLIALAALTSTISLLEVVTSNLIDQHGISRKRAAVACGTTVFLFTILAALLIRRSAGAFRIRDLRGQGRVVLRRRTTSCRTGCSRQVAWPSRSPQAGS